MPVATVRGGLLGPGGLNWFNPASWGLVFGTSVAQCSVMANLNLRSQIPFIALCILFTVCPSLAASENSFFDRIKNSTIVQRCSALLVSDTDNGNYRVLGGYDRLSLPWYVTGFESEDHLLLRRNAPIDDLVHQFRGPDMSVLKTEHGWNFSFPMQFSGVEIIQLDSAYLVRALGMGLDDRRFAMEAFISMIFSFGKLGKFFFPNPLKIEDTKIRQRLKTLPYRSTSPITVTLAEALKDHKESMVLVPETHGSIGSINAVSSMIRSRKYSWLAMEMFPVHLQSSINEYLSAETSQDEFAASKKLQAYARSSWKTNLIDSPSDAINLYLQLLKECRENNVRVIAMEPIRSKIEIGMEVIGKLRTRNYLWARLIPTTGRGIVFGGYHHFESPFSGNFQDFLPPQRDFLLLKRSSYE